MACALIQWSDVEDPYAVDIGAAVVGAERPDEELDALANYIEERQHTSRTARERAEHKRKQKKVRDSYIYELYLSTFSRFIPATSSPLRYPVSTITHASLAPTPPSKYTTLSTSCWRS